MSRSVTLAIAYLMSEHGGSMTLIDAFQAVKERRKVASPNPGFMAQLVAYERRIKGGTITLDLEKFKCDRFGEPDTFMFTPRKPLMTMQTTEMESDDDDDDDDDDDEEYEEDDAEAFFGAEEKEVEVIS
jgi:hypothetical protein